MFSRENICNRRASGERDLDLASATGLSNSLRYVKENPISLSDDDEKNNSCFRVVDGDTLCVYMYSTQTTPSDRGDCKNRQKDFICLSVIFPHEALYRSATTKNVSDQAKRPS